eukprot:CAMPEP_0176444574 /NCGR_PEP_ID=MMETSP0127-20121128/23147_1 /TAXON_ID=938130 /ORGANISM="Platyophrya macrostoma, Strain WH" /LENGTH=2633 /DNA_ID=CAMNT_0017830115 /DNA_START=51 /DNA_END=7953 /DNA_ORIENTATION=-
MSDYYDEQGVLSPAGSDYYSMDQPINQKPPKVQKNLPNGAHSEPNGETKATEINEADLMIVEDDAANVNNILSVANLPDDKNVEPQAELKASIRTSQTAKLSSKEVDSLPDLFDFLLLPNQHELKVEELFENLIFSKDETAFAYLRIGKLFNHIANILEGLVDKSDLAEHTDKLHELRAFLDLFLRCLDGIRYTPSGRTLSHADSQLKLHINEGLLTKVLHLAGTKLQLLPDDADTLLIRFVLFVLESPEPYVTNVHGSYQILAKFLGEGLSKQPNKNFFRLLSLAVVAVPPSLTPVLIENVVVPLKKAIEASLQKSVVKEDQIDFEEKIHVSKNSEDAEEETNFQILNVLLTGLSNPSFKKAYADLGIHFSFYEIVRNTNAIFSKTPLKLSTRNTRAIINIVSNLLPVLDEKQFGQMRDAIFGDISKCIEEKQINFVLQNLIPLMVSINYSGVPVCMHFDENPEKMLAQFKSRNPVASNGSDCEAGQLNSEILSTSERQVLLQNVQRLSVGPKSDTQMKNLSLDAYEWKRSFKIDYHTRYAMNTAKIHQEIQNNEGVLFVFQCLVDNEVFKLGFYSSDKLAMAPPTDIILAHQYKNSESKLAMANAQNFAFLYTPNQKLHFLSNQKPANKGEKLSEGKTQPTDAGDRPVFVEFCDSKIYAYIGGSSIIEYHPIRPEHNKVTINPNKLSSLESGFGQKVKEFKADNKGFNFIQSVECWTLNLPSDKKSVATQEDAVTNYKYISTKAAQESTQYLRSKSMLLVPGEISVEQLFALTFKDYSAELAPHITCKVLPNEPVDLGIHVDRLLELYDGKTQNVLDLFVSTGEAGSKLRSLFLGNSAKVYQRFNKLASSKKDSLICRMLTVEKLEEMMKKIAILAEKNKKDFENDFITLSNEINTFLTVTGFHKHLVEDESFFMLLLKVIDISIKNDIETYQRTCMFYKLERIAFKALHRVFQAKQKESFDKSKLQDLVLILLKKMTELPAVTDLTAAVQSASEEKSAEPEVKLGDLLEGGKNYGSTEEKAEKKAEEKFKKMSQALRTRLCKDIFQFVISSVETLCEWDFDRKLKRDFMNRVKQLKLIRPISSIIGDCSADNRKAKSNPFYHQLNGLLKRWSQDFIYSEIFWEPVADSENKNAELNFSLYQMLMNRSEANQKAIEENVNKKDKEKESEESIQRRLDFIDFYNTISANLKQLYMIDVVEKVTNLSEYLALPLSQSYSKLLQDQCVDSTSMKNESGEFVHHYKSSFSSSPNETKTKRIVKELNDLTNSLPIEHTNAIFVRYDKDKMDVMKSLIMGSAGTPYAHGAFIYDLYVGDNYPSGPPMCNLETTGNHTVRFNPNLYSCGKVCLSLLGTWRGSTNENWNPQLSTILQILVSIQSLIMTEDVYFNEPGYEGTKGSTEGDLLNEGYSNIVKWANVKYAMTEVIRNPYPWFKEVCQIHFYLKKDMILEEVGTWITAAKTTTGQYTGLVSSHNSSICSQFSSSQETYYNMLVEAVEELKEELNNLNISISKTITSRSIQWKKKDFMGIVDDEADIDTKVEKLDAIDVTYEDKVKQKAIDLNDEAVTNRWSRYIGAMGLEAVEKQANAQICLFGLNALGVEIAKNIVLSGCKRFTVFDGKKVEYDDISGQFYLSEADVGKNRAQACLNKLQALNQYVVIDYVDSSLEATYSSLDKSLLGYNVVIACEGSEAALTALNDHCRANNSYFIAAMNLGMCSRVFCDFGENFKVVDKTGEEFPDMLIQELTNDENGTVKLMEGTKHDLQDGDEVFISEIEEDQSDPSKKTLKGTFHKVKVINKSSFTIGDTTMFHKYVRNGVIKQMKATAELNFKSLSQIEKEDKIPPFDQTISATDWNFAMRGLPLHIAFKKYDEYCKTKKTVPKPWSTVFSKEFCESVETELKEKHPDDWKTISESENNLKLFQQIVNGFAHTCRGTFPPLAAFVGGMVAQEAIKAITKKYCPIQQYFYYECTEIINGVDPDKVHCEVIKPESDRDYGLKKCIGHDLFFKLSASKVFMVGAGAIGCELLKNYAMLSLGTSKEKGKEGRIYLTDPDVIENSNLNRQFLFREKHIRNPKSTTAAAVAVAMNVKLKGNVMPLVEKVHDQTEKLFTNKFFERMDVVTNALDNIHARRYVDARCVKSRTPLLESGTLGPKGHVQVVIPFKTESYGSQQDPQDNNEIPYCTLKMFPEETLHCVEWARDKFNKMFTSKPKSFERILENSKVYEDLLTQEHVILREALNFLKARPENFDDCVTWARHKFHKFFVNDIKQLLHTYPLDKKLENGNLFWTLPKRPPTELEFDPQNEIHASFIGALACLRAVSCNVKVPECPRELKTKIMLAEQASNIKVKEFVPSDKKAQELKEQADKGKTDPANKEANKPQQPTVMEMSKEEMAKNILSLIKEKVGDLEKAREVLKVTPQEFEKDEDENYHIDVLYSMTNCRALNYKLEKMDWITVKLKAGRIIPALATTTSAIAGLQTIELVKLIANVKLEEHKNTFLNLSLPSLTQSEPSSAPVYTISANLKATLWDRWDIRLSEHKQIVNLKTLFSHLAELTGLEPLDCLRGNTAVFVSQLMAMGNKAQERDLLLERPLSDSLMIRPSEELVDLTVTFTNEAAKIADPKDITIKGVPPIRLIL